MNRDNVQNVIDAIREEKYGFDMGDFMRPTEEHPCGTAACIGGTAALLSDVLDDSYIFDRLTGVSISRLGALYMGLDWGGYGSAAYNLFYAVNMPGLNSLSDSTREQAIRVLEHLRDTGEVDWTKAVQ